MGGDWSKFTKQAKEVLEKTTYYALMYPDGQVVKPEHIFISMLNQPESDALQIISSMDITLETIQAEVIATFPKTADPREEAKKNYELTLSPQGKEVFKKAVIEAKKDRLDYIGTRQILLGMIKVESLDISKILVKKGVTPDKIYASSHRTKERVAMETWVKAIYLLIFLIVLIVVLVNYFLF